MIICSVENKPIGNALTQNADKAVKSTISDVSFEGIRVLAVDDNKVNLKVVTKVLNKYKMNVTAAESGQESINMCKENDYDIILMDQMMPEMDGIEAMKEIRKVSARYAPGGECVIIALTANAVTGIKEELIGLGFDDYLSKPIEFANMERMFSELISTGRIKI